VLNGPLSSWPCFSKEEIDAVAAVLQSGQVNYWTGEEGRLFEREFAERMGARHAVALMNGTVALDLALKGIGIGQGDEVIVSPRTFIASVSCVVNAGAKPVFADVNPDSGNITAETIEAVLTPRTRAIIPVHLAGWPCNMTAMMALADAHGLAVIEDCAQAHGARHRGRSVGSFGRVGAWSFCQDKIMTTGGEGGMVTTNDPDLWSRMWSYKDHGKSWSAVYERQHPPGYRWVHESFGTNWRMLELQAVIGRIQLGRLDSWVEVRNRNALAIAEVAARHAGVLRTPMPDPRDTHAYYRFHAYVRPEALRAGWDRDRIIAEINARGGGALSGGCGEVYREKAFEAIGMQLERPLPAAHRLGETSIALLTHPTLSQSDIDQIRDALDTVLLEAAR